MKIFNYNKEQALMTDQLKN